jgi:predicted TIM-barrel fold metal-dependent hydrolase
MRIDVNAFLGDYPFRRVPGGTAEGLLEAMDRTGIDQAWISHLSAVFWRDPTEGNAVVYEAATRQTRFRPVPAVHPELPGWQDVLRDAVARGAPCTRADPTFYGLDPAGAEMRALVTACGELDLPVLLSVRFEDGRQRHRNDGASELPPWAVRLLVRTHPRVRLLVSHADREFIEQVHFGSTPAEAERILWDICWIWGPPEDHLGRLLRTVGVGRFTFGTGMPLRLPEASVAKLDLLDLSPEERTAIEEGNLRRLTIE